MFIFFLKVVVLRSSFSELLLVQWCHKLKRGGRINVVASNAIERNSSSGIMEQLSYLTGMELNKFHLKNLWNRTTLFCSSSHPPMIYILSCWNWNGISLMILTI